jgi:two-component sensor histidine kinase
MTESVRILYIDDDAGLGVLLTRALRGHGYEVVSVQSGDEAMTRLTSEPFDVVALDHNLTNEVGLDLIPAIRALPHAPPIVYVTGSEDVRIAVAALKAGAVDYVWKDVQGHYRELLRQAVDTAMEQAKLKQAHEDNLRQIAEARDRAELLLKEVNHRVANSLAIVSSFIQLQSNAMSDPAAKSAMRDTQARVTAIAGVHKRLYTSSDVRFVEINSYLDALVQELTTSLDVQSLQLKFFASGADIMLATDKAVSLGVIITELLTNAAKYAYDGLAGGEIRVRVARPGDNSIEVAVEDDGIGWRGAGEVKGTGLGSRIIKATAQALHAELTYDADVAGTRAVLRIHA